jgi:hypothetical protein
LLGDLQRGAARLALVPRRILREYAELELRRLQVGGDLPRDRPLLFRFGRLGTEPRSCSEAITATLIRNPALFAEATVAVSFAAASADGFT